MKLRDSAAGAMAAWQAMTMTGPSAPPPPNAAAALQAETDALASWRAMTMTPAPSAPASISTGTPFQAGTAGGFAVAEPAKPGAGSWANPVTGTYAGMGPATTPLRDNPTQLPNFGKGASPPAAQEPLPTFPAVAENPPPSADDLRGLTVDEKRYAQGNELLTQAYQQGYAVAPYLAAAGMKPLADTSAKPGARRDGYTLQVSESFDNGLGLFSRAWGPGVDTSVPGQITMRRVVENGQEMDSGAMVPPTGKDAGYGYGLYSFDMTLFGNAAPGPYALLWPGTDVWPGPEMDLVERLPGGAVYSTLHWNDGGNNAFASIGMDGIDGNARHTYQYDWQPNALSVYVDGKFVGTYDNAPRSARDGGENAAPGIGMQTWWSKDAQSGENGITLFGFSYEAAP